MRGALRRGIGGETWSGRLLTVGIAVLWYLGQYPYYWLNHGPARLSLESGLDRALPVVPVFVVPYVSLTAYIGVLMAVLLLVRVAEFRRTASAMLIAWGVSYAVYAVAQSYITRPALTGGDVFSAMIRRVYAADNPYNDFPSLHTSLSTLVAISWWRVDRRLGAVASVWSALIVASTVLIKQHHLADVAGGLAVAAVASAIASRLPWTRDLTGDAASPS